MADVWVDQEVADLIKKEQTVQVINELRNSWWDEVVKKTGSFVWK